MRLVLAANQSPFSLPSKSFTSRDLYPLHVLNCLRVLFSFFLGYAVRLSPLDMLHSKFPVGFRACFRFTVSKQVV